MNPSEEATPLSAEYRDLCIELLGYRNATHGSKLARLSAMAINDLSAELVQLRRQVAVHVHDCPTFQQFWEKHALGSKLQTSCLKCGKIGKPSIQHLKLPNIYICESCCALTSALAAERGKAFMEHGAAIAEWLNELYAVMVDPCAEGTMRVVDTKAAIMKSALATREELNRRANTQSALGNTDGGSNV